MAYPRKLKAFRQASNNHGPLQTRYQSSRCLQHGKVSFGCAGAVLAEQAHYNVAALPCHGRRRPQSPGLPRGPRKIRLARLSEDDAVESPTCTRPIELDLYAPPLNATWISNASSRNPYNAGRRHQPNTGTVTASAAEFAQVRRPRNSPTIEAGDASTTVIPSSPVINRKRFFLQLPFRSACSYGSSEGILNSAQ